VVVNVRHQIKNFRTPKVGLVVEGTSDCLATVEYEDQGYVIYHVLSGCTIASNLDNMFKSRGKAEEFALKFWYPISQSMLAYAKYRTCDEIDILRAVTPLASSLMAKKRTAQATDFGKKKKGLK
jgi:hypothetical protein